MIVACIPPQVRGSDPEKVRGLLELCKNTLKEGIAQILEDARKPEEDVATKLDELADQFRTEAQALRKDIDFKLKDAAKLNSFYWFKVDPRLRKDFEALSVTAAYVFLWCSFASRVVTNKNKNNTQLGSESGDHFRDEATALLERFEKGKPESSRCSSAKDGSGSGSSIAEEVDERIIQSTEQEPELLLDAARFICSHLEKADQSLLSIQTN
jgi:hypothetical protein